MTIKVSDTDFDGPAQVEEYIKSIAPEIIKVVKINVQETYKE